MLGYVSWHTRRCKPPYLVGWVNTARYKWAEIMGREIKFKPATFYLGITDYLARIVEGQEARQPRYSEDGREEILERADPVKGSESGEIKIGRAHV